MFRTVALASISALVLAAGAHAQEGTGTFSVGASQAEYGDLKFTAATLRGTLNLTRHFSVEGEASWGLDGDNVGGVDVDLNYNMGAYAVARFPIDNDRIVFFGRAGYTRTEIEASLLGFAASGEDEAWAYGVGGEFYIDEQNGLRLDYTRIDYTGEDATYWGVSYVRRFNG